MSESSVQNILIIGANSAIAKALARRHAGKGHTLYLLARDGDALEQQKQDLLLRGAAEIHTDRLDVNDADARSDCLDKAWQKLGRIDTALICHGTLPDQQAIAHDWEQIHREIETNALSTLAILCHLAPRFREQSQGCIAVISSVAGDRGRKSNYVYGAAKSMVSRYLEGLRGELLPAGVHVLDIRPGFVDTPMTAEFDKGLLWSKPQRIAAIIDRAISRRRDVVYAPGFWRPIMLIIRCIPEFLFKRLNL